MPVAATVVVLGSCVLASAAILWFVRLAFRRLYARPAHGGAVAPIALVLLGGLGLATTLGLVPYAWLKAHEPVDRHTGCLVTGQHENTHYDLKIRTTGHSIVTSCGTFETNDEHYRGTRIGGGYDITSTHDEVQTLTESR